MLGKKSSGIPFRTVVPFGGQGSWNLTGLLPERDYSTKRIKEAIERKVLAKRHYKACPVATSKRLACASRFTCARELSFAGGPPRAVPALPLALISMVLGWRVAEKRVDRYR